MRLLITSGLWLQVSITPFLVHVLLAMADDYEHVGYGLNPLAAYFLVNVVMLGAFAAVRLLIQYAVSDAKAKKRGKLRPGAADALAAHSTDGGQ